MTRYGLSLCPFRCRCACVQAQLRPLDPPGVPVPAQRAGGRTHQSEVGQAEQHAPETSTSSGAADSEQPPAGCGPARNHCGSNPRSGACRHPIPTSTSPPAPAHSPANHTASSSSCSPRVASSGVCSGDYGCARCTHGGPAPIYGGRGPSVAASNNSTPAQPASPGRVQGDH